MNASRVKVRRWFGGVLATGLCIAAFAAGGASTALGASCGDLKKSGHTYAKDIKAKNISCKKAKGLIHKYFIPGNDLNGYSCKGYPRSVCRKGNTVIKFTYA